MEWGKCRQQLNTWIVSDQLSQCYTTLTIVLLFLFSYLTQWHSPAISSPLKGPKQHLYDILRGARIHQGDSLYRMAGKGSHLYSSLHRGMIKMASICRQEKMLIFFIQTQLKFVSKGLNQHWFGQWLGSKQQWPCLRLYKGTLQK